MSGSVLRAKCTNNAGNTVDASIEMSEFPVSLAKVFEPWVANDADSLR